MGRSWLILSLGKLIVHLPHRYLPNLPLIAREPTKSDNSPCWQFEFARQQLICHLKVVLCRSPNRDELAGYWILGIQVPLYFPHS